MKKGQYEIIQTLITILILSLIVWGISEFLKEINPVLEIPFIILAIFLIVILIYIKPLSS